MKPKYKDKDQLQETEQKFRESANLLPQIIFETDSQGNITFVNKQAYDSFVFSKADFDKGLNALQRIQPEDRARAKKNILNVLSGKPVENPEYTAIKKDGSTFPIRVYSSPIIKNNKTTGMRGIIIDITEQKKAEKLARYNLELEKLINKISISFANASAAGIDNAINSALEKITLFSQAKRSSLFILTKDLETITNTHEWCAKPEDSQIKLLQNIPFSTFGWHREELLQEKTIAISRFEDYPPKAKGEKEWMKKHGFRSMLFIPLLKKGHLYGALGCYGEKDKEGNWPSEFVNMLKTIGNIILNILERKQTEESLQNSESTLRMALKTARLGNWVWNLKDNSFTMSDEALAIYGFTDKNQTIFQEDLHKCIHPDDFKTVSDNIQKALHSKKTVYTEYRIITPAGKLKWIYADHAPIEEFDDAGKPLKMIGVFLDITESRHVQRLMETERNFGLEFSRTTSLEGTLNLCLNKAIEVSDMDCGGIYLIDEKTGALDLVLQKGLPEAFIKSARHFDAGSPNVNIIMKGKPIYTRHTELSIKLDVTAEVRRQEKLRAIAILPILHHNKVIACLNISSHLLDEFPHFSRIRLESLRSHIGGAITHSKAEAALRQNREILRAYMDSATEAFVIFDSRLNIIDINKAHLKMFHPKTKKQEFIGKNLLDIVPNLKESGRYKEFMDVIKNGKPFNADEIIPHSKFSKRNLAVKAFKVGDGLGTITRDITKQKNAEEELKKRHMHLASLLTLEFGTDQDANIQLVVNDTAKLFESDVLFNQLVVMPEREDILHTLFCSPGLENLLGEDYASNHLCRTIIQEAIKTGQTLFEIPDLQSSATKACMAGKTNPYLHSYCSVVIDHSETGGFNLCAISARKESFDEIEKESLQIRARQISGFLKIKEKGEALIQAQRLSAIGEVVSGVAHDFNNALQGIIGNIELVLLNDILPDASYYLKTIKQIACDAASRIQQLQRFSGKIEIGGQSHYQQLNLNSVIDDVILQAKPLWKDSSEKANNVIAVKKNCQKKELSIYANPGEIRSSLFNLVKNSIQAMPKGGTLTFETKATKKGAYITISDTGIGMDEKTKTRIFQPFFTTKGFEQGKGLGLSTVYAIIKEHGGDVYIKESAPGKGTSIEIMLPLSKRKESRIGEIGDPYPGFMGSVRVLLVDDEEMNRQVGKAQLEILNHKVDVAADGKEALGMLQKNQYDLMITDIGMPDMNGWQLAERIRSNYPGMKVVIMTGWGADVSNKEKEKYGVSYVLEKPTDMNQLKNMVNEVLLLK